MNKTDQLMKNVKRFLLYSMLVATVLLSSCSDDDPEPTNEEELITTVNLVFQKLDGTTPVGDPLTFTWKDLDGDGPNAPVIDPVVLEASTTYDFSIQLLNESNASSVEDITEEVEEENTDHQFFYTVAAALQLSIQYNDEDGNGDPVGLTNKATTAAASTGKVTVILRHQPDKSAAGVADGDITNAGGETDVQAEFNVTIN